MNSKEARPAEESPLRQAQDQRGEPPAASAGPSVRVRAEQIVRDQVARSPVSHDDLSPQETQLKLHELRVHQIELELQNEELRRSQVELSTLQTRYFDLYDLAPVGYVTVSERGLILQANLAAATLLGEARAALLKQRISRFVLEEDHDVYYLLRKRLLDSDESQSCELRLARAESATHWVSMVATVTHNAEGALVIRCVLIDVTKRKKIEEALREREKEMRCLADVSKLINSDTSLATVLQFCAERLPDGWFHPDVACARVTLNGTSYQTPNFRETAWRQSTSIEADGSLVGKVEVHYLEERPQRDEGPFLTEERRLLGEIARRIGWAVDREHARIFTQARLCIAELDSSGSDTNEILRAALDAAEAITASQIGFMHFVAADEASLTLQVWSTNTLTHMCTAEGVGRHYAIGDAGVWTDCVRTREAVIHNDYASLSHKKGMPEGHATVVRELVVPILRNGKVILILGVGNKADDYRESDVRAVQAIAETVQIVFERRLADAELRASEARWQFALDGAGDGVWDWNNVTNEVYYSPRWKSMLGFAPEDLGNTLEVWKDLVHPQDIESVMAEVLRHLSGATPAYACEHRLRCKDGSYKWVLDRGKVVERAIDGSPLRAIGTHTDITERMLAEQARRKDAERISALSRRLIEVQEEERARLARELHDEIGQVLTAVKLHLKVIERELAPAASNGLLGKSLSAVERAIGQVRSMSLDLRPPALDELGLVAALRSLVLNYSGYEALRIRLDAPSANVVLARGTAEALYRIAQESLTNVVRYAHAVEVVIRLEQVADRVTLSVRDDGCGFDVAGVRALEGFGLLGMEERAKLAGGTLWVHSTLGRGTEVRAEFGL